MHLHLTLLFLGFLLISFAGDNLLVRDNYNAELQSLFIGFYKTTPIWTMK